MNSIDKQVLREAAANAKIAGEAPVMPFDQRITALNDFMEHFTPAAALALLDELEAAEKRIAELQNDEVRQRLANAEHQLHMAELAKRNLRASRKAQFRKRKAAEKRIAELEARTVTLPAQKYCPGEYAGSVLWGEKEVWNQALSECAKAICAAGIASVKENESV